MNEQWNINVHLDDLISLQEKETTSQLAYFEDISGINEKNKLYTK